MSGGFAALLLRTRCSVPSRQPPARLPQPRVNDPQLAIRAAAALTLAMALSTLACGDGTTEPHSTATPTPSAVWVTPATLELSALGDTAQLTADVRDQSGQPMAGAMVTWTSEAPEVATVDGQGLVTAVGNGSATITASAGSVSGSARAWVAQEVRAVSVSAPGPVFVGDTVRLVAESHDANGHAVAGSEFSWASSDTAVATVDASGLVTGLVSGEAEITATSSGATGGVEVAVRSAGAVSVSPSKGAVPLGDTVRLVAEALDETGQPLAGVRFSWSSSRPEVANVDQAGLVTGLAVGSATIAATGAGVTGAADIAVTNPDRAALVAFYHATDGPNWFNNDNWLTDAPFGDWHGVRTDDSGRVVRLDLSWNGLSGAIPPELGNLSNLKWLYLGGNDLTGAIPPELGNLSNLTRLGLYANRFSGALPKSFVHLSSLRLFIWDNGVEGVCAPGTSSFVGWLDGILDGHGPLCNAADEAALIRLHELAGGDDWIESDGWVGGPVLDAWYGVEADSLGRVTALELSDNGLSGLLPRAMGDLGRLASLRIDGNALGGRLPLSLTALDLAEFHYDGTDLCEPAEAGFRDWLDGIPSRRGTSVQCAPLTDRDALVALHRSTGGLGWSNRDGWLTDAPLGDWFGVRTDDSGRVVGLDLGGNNLSGAIPPELGSLSNLELLSLMGNDLKGAIPPELGNLSNLWRLILGYNELTGAIPPELGSLSNLRILVLSNNDLSGAIPPELGNLSNLEWLFLGYNALSSAIPPELGGLSNLRDLRLWQNDLSGAIPPELGNLSNLVLLDFSQNDLSGPIPPELGNLSKLVHLSVSQNDVSGPIPPTFGGLTSLTHLGLVGNMGLTGALPASMINLTLESLVAGTTDLCVPREPPFNEWLAAIPKQWIAVCGEPPSAYLVQAVQSRAHPVPLVAGEDALLRVFVTAATETTEGMPDVRARFFLNGAERHVADIPASSTLIPTEIDEGDLAKSANAVIPGSVVRPGLEMVIEIDPGGALDASLGVPRRIPAEGRLGVEVHEMPVFDLTVIPFLWDSDPDSAIIGLVEGMAADPDGHALLEATRVLLPVADIDVTAHAPVVSTNNNMHALLRETEALQVLEGGGFYYMGMMSGTMTSVGGVAGGSARGRANFSASNSSTIAHELGHNMNLGHAPCGLRGADPSFPYPDGAIGAWGYDFGRHRLVPPTQKDHMSYCHPKWTSDYHFTNALRFRLLDEGAARAAAAAPPARSLLLWGGTDSVGVPFLEPAFVVDSPQALPDSAGDWRLTGRAADGRELFSLSFAMREVADAGGRSSFVFALPARPGWEDLASITLAGPDAETTLDGGTDRPMAILRDPGTGQVRGFLRDLPDIAAAQAAVAAAATAGPGLGALFSRGIPDPLAWRR